MPNRVILDDADKDLAMKEGISAARGDEFILENGEQFQKNPLVPVSSYGTQSFELITHGYSEDQVIAPDSMTRPFCFVEYNSGAGVGPHHEGKNPYTEPGHTSSHYAGDSGKYRSDVRTPDGFTVAPHTESIYENNWEDGSEHSKNDRF
jgi:hypothetical protein